MSLWLGKVCASGAQLPEGTLVMAEGLSAPRRRAIEGRNQF